MAAVGLGVANLKVTTFSWRWSDIEFVGLLSFGLFPLYGQNLDGTPASTQVGDSVTVGGLGSGAFGESPPTRLAPECNEAHVYGLQNMRGLYRHAY